MSVLADRFWSKVEIGAPDACWPWRGYVHPKGYARFWLNGRNVTATRVALRLVGRPVPEGLFALHSCDNRICMNPHHLRHGTAQENMDEMWLKGRGCPPLGERQTGHKVSAADVAVIRRRVAAGEFQRVVAADYGVAQPTISDIVTGRNWSWLS